jgi:hypothetical protein
MHARVPPYKRAFWHRCQSPLRVYTWFVLRMIPPVTKRLSFFFGGDKCFPKLPADASPFCGNLFSYYLVESSKPRSLRRSSVHLFRVFVFGHFPSLQIIAFAGPLSCLNASLRCSLIMPVATPFLLDKTYMPQSYIRSSVRTSLPWLPMYFPQDCRRW